MFASVVLKEKEERDYEKEKICKHTVIPYAGGGIYRFCLRRRNYRMSGRIPGGNHCYSSGCGEYKKYKARTLSTVEEDYLNSIKILEKKTDKKQ